MKRATPLRTKKLKASPEEQLAREVTRSRSGGLCEICGDARATNFHHRKNRSQGGQWCPSNSLDLCGSGTTGCHGLVGANPKRSYEQGWLVRRGHDPAKTPVWLAGRGFAWLTDDGSIEEIDEEIE